jgi:hypothetical protein
MASLMDSCEHTTQISFSRGTETTDLLSAIHSDFRVDSVLLKADPPARLTGFIDVNDRRLEEDHPVFNLEVPAIGLRYHLALPTKTNKCL